MPRKAVEGGAGKRVPLNMKTTEEIRAKLEEAAAASGRSLTAEVEYRLEQSFVQKELFDMVITQLRMAFDKEDEIRAALEKATARMAELQAASGVVSEESVERAVTRALERFFAQRATQTVGEPFEGTVTDLIIGGAEPAQPEPRRPRSKPKQPA